MIEGVDTIAHHIVTEKNNKKQPEPQVMSELLYHQPIPKGRLGMSDVSSLSGISGLSFESTLLVMWRSSACNMCLLSRLVKKVPGRRSGHGYRTFW